MFPIFAKMSDAIWTLLKNLQTDWRHGGDTKATRCLPRSQGVANFYNFRRRCRVLPQVARTTRSRSRRLAFSPWTGG